MTRAQFLRICAGLAAAPLVAARELRASAPIATWVAHPGGGDGGHDGDSGDGHHSGGCGDEGENGTAWFDSSSSGGCGSGGDGGDEDGHHHRECDEDHPSPENATAILGVLGAAAACWPSLKEKIRSFRDEK